MSLFRPILVAVVGLALASYAFDCFAAATPEQAMQCCNSMRCSSHAHHGQDCCKRMPNVRSPFVGASSDRGISLSLAAPAVMPARGELPVFDFSARIIPAHSHPPPLFSFSASVPLRI